MPQALVFTRTKHRANRLADTSSRPGIKADRIHGNRSQAQRTAALAGFKSGTYRVLVATDIAARGIDVEALGHVVNFDVPWCPRTTSTASAAPARAEATGEAFTFVSPEEEADLRAIERAIGKRAAARDRAGLRLHGAAAAEARGPAGRAHRGDSEDEGRAAGQVRHEERPGPRPEGGRATAPGPGPRAAPGARRRTGRARPGPVDPAVRGGGRGRGPSRGGRSWGGRGNQ